MIRRSNNERNIYVGVAVFGSISGASLGLLEVFCGPGLRYSLFLVDRTLYYSAAARCFIIFFDTFIGILAASVAAICLSLARVGRQESGTAFPRSWLSALTLLFLALFYGLMAVNSNAVMMGVGAKLQALVFCGYTVCMAVFVAAYVRLLRGVSDPSFLATHTLASLYFFFVLVQGHALRWLFRGATRSGLMFGSNMMPMLYYALLFAGLMIGLTLILLKAPSLRRILALTTPGVLAAILCIRLAMDRPPQIEQTQKDRVDERIENAQDLPNIILMVFDTLRSDHLSCYGYERKTSPNIDRFSEEAVTYLQSYSSSSWTLPGHASIFTGLLPHEHHAHSEGIHALEKSDGMNLANPLPLELDTIAEILKRYGYRTGAVAANDGWLNKYYQMDQGFDFFHTGGRAQSKIPILAAWSLEKCDAPLIRRMLRGPYNMLLRDYGRHYLDADEIFSIAGNWLDSLKEGPFFLFLNLMNMHDPYLPPWPYDRIFDGKLANVPRHGVLRSRFLPEEQSFNDATVKHLISQYDGELAAMDAAFGRFQKNLKERGLYDDAMLLLTSDHGEQLGEQGLIWHRVGLHEPSVRVPLLIRYPGGSRGSVKHTAPVDSRGILPTVLDTIGKPVPEALRQMLLDDFSVDVTLEEFADAGIVRRYGNRFSRDLAAVRVGDNKIIKSSEGQEEIYALTTRSLEEVEATNLAPNTKAYLQEKAAKALSLMEMGLRKPKTIMHLDEEVRSRLQALGYI